MAKRIERKRLSEWWKRLDLLYKYIICFGLFLILDLIVWLFS